MLEKAEFKRFNTFRRFIVLGQQSRKWFVGLLVRLLKLVPAENLVSRVVLSLSAQLRKVPGRERAAVQPNPLVKRTTFTGKFTGFYNSPGKKLP